MTLFKQRFQSEILLTVNSTSSLSFIYLAKNYDTLRFKKVYNSVLDIFNLHGEAVTNTVCGLDQFCCVYIQNTYCARLVILWLYVFFAMFTVKAQTVFFV